MTYHNKLLLKRMLIVLAILVAAALLFALISFIYLGRYVIYTQDGAYFSFHEAPAADTLSPSPPPQLDAIDLRIGASISAGEGLDDDSHSIPDTEVNGILLDYETLSGSTASELELSLEGYNTLVLEMRREGSPILDAPEVLSTITWAKSQELRLIAMISCLDDNEYALAHRDEALEIDGGALWVDGDNNYWLDPTQDSVISYLAQFVRQLSELGFDEVILNKFSFPTSDMIDYDVGDSSRSSLLADAFNDLLDATADYCDIGLLVTDPDDGHQALDSADRIYVYFSDGSSLKSYAAEHPDQYLVFLTDSHDTRFDSYGKLTTGRNLNENPTSGSGDGSEDGNYDDAGYDGDFDDGYYNDDYYE